ncbi:MAG: hypothetical protein AAF907_03545, partial [Planctomycetota bacterium]
GIAELLADDDRRAAFGDRARSRILEEFNVGDRVRRMVDLYRELGAPLEGRDGVLDLDEPIGSIDDRPR